MKIGDVVRMSRTKSYGLGLIQKIVETQPMLAANGGSRLVYHIRWPDGGISVQYDNEIVLVSRVK